MRVLHAALLVSDLARAEAFYGDALGLMRAPRSLDFPGTWYQIGEFQIHLIVGIVGAAGERAPGNPHKWGRNAHLAFAVADLEAVRSRLEAGGYALQPSSSGRAAVFARDPDGNIIELAQA